MKEKEQVQVEPIALAVNIPENIQSNNDGMEIEEVIVAIEEEDEDFFPDPENQMIEHAALKEQLKADLAIRVLKLYTKNFITFKSCMEFLQTNMHQMNLLLKETRSNLKRKCQFLNLPEETTRQILDTLNESVFDEIFMELSSRYRQ